MLFGTGGCPTGDEYYADLKTVLIVVVEYSHRRYADAHVGAFRYLVYRTTQWQLLRIKRRVCLRYVAFSSSAREYVFGLNDNH